MDVKQLPLYVPHPGTVKIAGSTVPRKAAWCAFAFLEERRPNVEFMFIGASSGQQALKAIGILTDIFESKWEADFVILFRPMRFRTVIAAQDNLPEREVDAQAWRVHILDLKQLAQPK